MRSSLSPRMHKIQHSWNTYPYFIELLECFDSEKHKWFVKTCAGTIMICDSKHEDFSGFWLYSPRDQFGFDTAEEALVGFDRAMAYRYRGISL